MTFREFIDSPLSKSPHWMAVSFGSGDAVKCEVLQWEPSNRKWYRPQPVQFRKECGYCSTIDANSAVHHVRLIAQPGEPNVPR